MGHRRQVLLSYRTTSSRAARLVAAWLAHNGVGAWFAEGRIGIDQQFDDEAIRASLGKAVEDSSHFLLLTDPGYAASPWCAMEAELIGERRRSRPTPVMEIGPSADRAAHQRFAYLGDRDVGRVEMAAGTIPNLSAIEGEMRRRDWPLPARMRGLVAPESPGEAATVRTPFGIDVPLFGWRSADEDPVTLGVQPDGSGLEVQHFRRSLPVRAEAAVAFVTHRANPDRPSFRDATDREVRDWAMRQAVARFGDQGIDVTFHGVHIDFLWGRAQLGVTYTLGEPHPSLGTVAVRKYWCCLGPAGSNRDVEVVSTFSVYGGLRRLNALSPLFDHYLHAVQSALRPCFDPGSAASGGPVSRFRMAFPETLRLSPPRRERLGGSHAPRAAAGRGRVRRVRRASVI